MFTFVDSETRSSNIYNDLLVRYWLNRIIDNCNAHIFANITHFLGNLDTKIAVFTLLEVT